MENKLDFNKESDMEKFVGIESYSTSTIALGGELKSNPSDFIVCEITPQRKILNTTYDKIVSNYNFDKNTKYTAFNLVKTNTDTIIAAQVIAKSLEIPSRFISWAGIKDNRAITVQRMCIRGDYCNKISKLNFNGIFIKNITSRRNPIKVGDLWGNNFRILLRNYKKIDGIKEFLENFANEIKFKGFPNYFGLQRFGSHRPNSHLIGKHLFLKQYKKATEELLFETYPREIDKVRECRNRLRETQDYKEALGTFPEALFYERIVIEYLEKHPEQYFNALKQLPRSLLNILLSSYQSYLYNKAISKRIELKHELQKPRKGDMISLLFDERGPITPIYYEYGNWYDEHLDKVLKMGRASILCPIIGYESDFSKGYFGPIYREIFEKENFSPESFKNNELQTFNFKGTYRPIYIIPLNFSIELMREKKKKSTPPIKLVFSLPKGTYATMLIRELQKFV